jgi:murein DD-endopeptidase MepM/ murein hydrolase activator NlpD
VPALLSRPFAGSLRLTNYFDHDLPIQFQGGNEFQLTTCGERVTGGIDGHSGYDWLLPAGTPLLATADGTVIFAGTDGPFWCPILGRTVSDQLVVSIRSEGSDRYDSQYLHLSRVDVAEGDPVARGQVLGLSGNTGCSTEPHLHFQVRAVDGPNPGALIDPYGWAGDEPDPWAAHPDGAQSVWLWRDGEGPEL